MAQAQSDIICQARQSNPFRLLCTLASSSFSHLSVSVATGLFFLIGCSLSISLSLSPRVGLLQVILSRSRSPIQLFPQDHLLPRGHYTYHRIFMMRILFALGLLLLETLSPAVMAVRQTLEVRRREEKTGYAWPCGMYGRTGQGRGADKDADVG